MNRLTSVMEGLSVSPDARNVKACLHYMRVINLPGGGEISYGHIRYRVRGTIEVQHESISAVSSVIDKHQGFTVLNANKYIGNKYDIIIGVSFEYDAV